VPLQQPRPGEAFPAEGALAALTVRAHVHTEGRHRHVDLVAVRTSPRLLVGQGPVGLPVTRQVAAGAVGLPAVSTAVVFPLLVSLRLLEKVNT
jgi:hypothetical protein